MSSVESVTTQRFLILHINCSYCIYIKKYFWLYRSSLPHAFGFLITLLFLFQIDLVLTCEELLESRPVKKLFSFLHIHHWYAIQKSRKLYPNIPETLLPQWCKRGGDDEDLANSLTNGTSDKARRWVAKRYAKWWITDDYRTSGVNICDKINPPQVLSCYMMITCWILEFEVDC